MDRVLLDGIAIDTEGEEESTRSAVRRRHSLVSER